MNSSDEAGPKRQRRKTTRGLYKRGAVYWTAFSIGGRQIRLSTGETKAEDAKAAAFALEAKYRGPDASEPPEPKPRRSILDVPPFEIAVASYLEARTAEGKRASSYDALQSRNGEPALWAEVFAGRRVDSITSEEVESLLRRWKAERGWTDATRNNRLNQLSGLLSYCYGRRWITSHPTERGRVPKLKVSNQRERWLRTHELRAVIEKATERGHTYLPEIIAFAVKTGMRLGEVCSLRRADFETDDAGRAFVTVRKTKNGRPLVFPLIGEARAMVERRVKGSRFAAAYLFPGPNKGNARSSIVRHFREAVEAAGLEWGRTRNGITWHSLRRTMASLARNAGLTVEEIARLGNWNDRRMVEVYARFADETIEKAAAKLDRLTEKLSHFYHNRPSSGSRDEKSDGVSVSGAVV